MANDVPELAGSNDLEDRLEELLEQTTESLEPITPERALELYLDDKEREASLPDADGDAVEQKIETIEKLLGRLTAVTESAVSSLASAGELDAGEYDVLVDIRGGGSDYPIGELLRRGGRKCSNT